MARMGRQNGTQSGFTLVELSIVLVIIGLIISSVLVGQDLVRAAELRATITQYEGFNAAIGTFRGKYSGLPGDVAGATNFGFTGDGNGNGILEPTVAAGKNLTAAGTAPVGENVDFWSHLGSATLISGSYSGASVTSSNISLVLPAAKAGNYWGVYAGPATTTIEGLTSGSEAGTNYYILGVVGDATAGNYTTAATLTPLEAQNVDSKMDDGKPSTGIVRARGGATDAPDTVPLNDTGVDATKCVMAPTNYTNSPAANTYQTTGTGLFCNLRFKMPL